MGANSSNHLITFNELPHCLSSVLLYDALGVSFSSTCFILVFSSFFFWMGKIHEDASRTRMEIIPSTHLNRAQHDYLFIYYKFCQQKKIIYS